MTTGNTKLKEHRIGRNVIQQYKFSTTHANETWHYLEMDAEIAQPFVHSKNA